MRKILPIVIFVAAFYLHGFAQKNELAFVAGAKVTPKTGSTASGNQTTFSTTFAFEANYAAQLAHVPAVALHLEFPFVASPSTDLTSSNVTAVKSYNAIFFTPALRLKVLPGGPFSPWISAGGGLAHFSPGSTTQAGTTVSSTSTTKSAVQGGVGADFHPPLLPIAFRVEVRDFYTGIPNLNTLNIKVRHNLLVGGGVVLRF